MRVQYRARDRFSESVQANNGVNTANLMVQQVLDYNEEYHLTFPNGYGRSILTTPWIELGGTVTISCPQTGYHCDIEFLTKPFYGNRKHRVTADIYGPDEKKPFVSISGEWNGLMEAKWADKVILFDPL